MKKRICFCRSKVFPLRVEAIEKAGKNENGSAASTECIPIRLKVPYEPIAIIYYREIKQVSSHKMSTGQITAAEVNYRKNSKNWDTQTNHRSCP